MKETFKLGFSLLIVTFLAGFVLDSVYKITKPRIDSIKAREEAQARIEVMPGATAFNESLLDKDSGSDSILADTVDNMYWTAENEEGLAGYVLKIYGHGYDAVPITTMIGLRGDGSLVGIKVISQNETPGLGARCQETVKIDDVPVVWFTEQFKKLDAGSIEVKKVDVKEGENAIIAITGATVTSKAITDSVNKAAEMLFSGLSKDGDSE